MSIAVIFVRIFGLLQNDLVAFLRASEESWVSWNVLGEEGRNGLFGQLGVGRYRYVGFLIRV
jgi:hypothetical protein